MFPAYKELKSLALICWVDLRRSLCLLQTDTCKKALNFCSLDPAMLSLTVPAPPPPTGFFRKLFPWPRILSPSM